MTIPTMSSGGLQQTDGAPQQITVAGMTAWLQSVNGYRVSRKRALMAADLRDHAQVIATSRREVE